MGIFDLFAVNIFDETNFWPIWMKFGMLVSLMILISYKILSWGFSTSLPLTSLTKLIFGRFGWNLARVLLGWNWLRISMSNLNLFGFNLLSGWYLHFDLIGSCCTIETDFTDSLFELQSRFGCQKFLFLMKILNSEIAYIKYAFRGG